LIRRRTPRCLWLSCRRSDHAVEMYTNPIFEVDLNKNK
jgi:hypothetical protein